jgi:hypothetical protein
MTTKLSFSIDSVRIAVGRPLHRLLGWRIGIATKDDATAGVEQATSGE